MRRTNKNGCTREGRQCVKTENRYVRGTVWDSRHTETNIPFFFVMVFHSSSGAFSVAGDTTTATLGLPALPPFC